MPVAPPPPPTSRDTWPQPQRPLPTPILTRSVPERRFTTDGRKEPGRASPPARKTTHGKGESAKPTRPTRDPPRTIPFEVPKGTSWYTKRPEPQKAAEKPLPSLPPPVATPPPKALLVKQPLSRLDGSLREVHYVYAEILKDLEKGRLERVVSRSKGFGMPVLDALKDSKELPRTVRSTAIFLTAEQAFLFSKDVFVNFCAHAPFMRKAGKGIEPHSQKYQELRLIGYLLLEMTMSYVRDLVETSDAEQVYLHTSGAELSTVVDGEGGVVLRKSHVSRLSRLSSMQLRPYSDGDTLFGLARTKSTEPGFVNAATLDEFTKSFNFNGGTPVTKLGDLLTQFLQGKDDSHRKIVRGRDQTIAAATLPELVNVLTDEREYYGHYMIDLTDSFFLFFRLFAPPAVVLDMFIKRYKESPPEDMAGIDLVMWHVHHRMAKIHIARLLSLWLKVHWKEATDGHLVEEISKFQIGTLCKDPDIPIEWAKKVGNHLFDRSSTPTGPYCRWLHLEIARTEKAAEEFPVTVFEETQMRQWAKLHPFNPITVIHVTHFCQTGGPNELVQLLTIIESDFFHSFLPEDLIRFKDEGLQRKLDAWKSFSTSLTLWVVGCILGERDVAVRSSLVHMFSGVAMICKLVRNYSSALSIFLALQTTCIARLHQTEKLLPEEVHHTMAHLKEFFNQHDNWKAYRAELPRNLPAVPLEVVFLKDIMQCREVLPRVQTICQPIPNPEEEMIPLQYYRNMRRTVRDLEKCYGSYKMKRQDMLFEWFNQAFSPFRNANYDQKMNEFHEISVRLEPRAGKSIMVQALR